MIPKSGYRFSEKIMLQEEVRACVARMERSGMRGSRISPRYAGLHPGYKLRRSIEKYRQAAFVGVHRAEALGVVGRGDVDLARPELGIGDRHGVVAALDQR